MTTTKKIDHPVTTCRHCGAALSPWTLADLRYHLAMIERGEHAACACDDDCAARAPAWTREELGAEIAAKEAGR